MEIWEIDIISRRFQARLMSQALRKLTGVVSKFNCTVIFINQLREKVGVMFGNPETTTTVLFLYPFRCHRDIKNRQERLSSIHLSV